MSTAVVASISIPLKVDSPVIAGGVGRSDGRRGQRLLMVVIQAVSGRGGVVIRVKSRRGPVVPVLGRVILTMM